MPILDDKKDFIREEETKFRGAASERVMSKIGQALNFVTNKLAYFANFHISGGQVSPVNGLGGVFPILFDTQLQGILLYQFDVGTAGNLDLNVFKHNAATPAGVSIFSTTPQLNYAAGNNSFLWYDFLGDQLDWAPANPAHYRAPVVSDSVYSSGDVLALDPVSFQSGGTPANCGMIIFLKPVTLVP